MSIDVKIAMKFNIIEGLYIFMLEFIYLNSYAMYPSIFDLAFNW